MNIFVLDKDPVISAQMMCDKHVVKMCTESLQMISTIAHHYKLKHCYRPVMLNHPCTIWARKSKQNFQWLREHTYALCAEYSFRYYGRTHKVETTLDSFKESFDELEQLLPDIGLTPFAIAISDEQRCRQDPAFEVGTVHDKYRLYYAHDKKYFASWKKGAPSWWVY